MIGDFLTVVWHMLPVFAFGVVAVAAAAAAERGRRKGRADAVRFLRAQADAHRGQVGDQRRRAALNYAATRLEQGKPVGRP